MGAFYIPDNMFLLQMASCFVVGGLWVSGFTYVAARFGPKLGGYLSGLPSIVFISLLFISITQGGQVLYKVTGAMPLTLSLLAAFLLPYRIISKKISGSVLSASVAIFIWSLVQVPLIIFNFGSFKWAVLIWAFTVLLIVYIYYNDKGIINHKPANMVKDGLPVSVIMRRAILGGSVITTAVLFSKLFGPIVGSIFATFPAVFFSSLVVLHRAYGAEYARLIAMPMLLTAVVNSTVFVFFVRIFGLYTVPWQAVIWAYFPTVIVAFLVYKLINNEKRIEKVYST